MCIRDRYRLAGVDKDEATRKQIRALQDKITDLALTFGRNVADGTLKILSLIHISIILCFSACSRIQRSL